MTDKHAICKSVKSAKEHKRKTTVYCHECPHCGDMTDEYVDSMVGEIMECFCGKSYKVGK